MKKELTKKQLLKKCKPTRETFNMEMEDFLNYSLVYWLNLSTLFYSTYNFESEREYYLQFLLDKLKLTGRRNERMVILDYMKKLCNEEVHYWDIKKDKNGDW